MENIYTRDEAIEVIKTSDFRIGDTIRVCWVGMYERDNEKKMRYVIRFNGKSYTYFGCYDIDTYFKTLHEHASLEEINANLKRKPLNMTFNIYKYKDLDDIEHKRYYFNPVKTQDTND